MSAKHRATRSSSPERMRRTGAGSASSTACHGSTVSLARSRSAPCRANASTTDGSNQLPDRSRSIDMTASTPPAWWNNSAWVATSLSRAARVISTPASPRGPPVPSQRSNCWAIAAATRSPSPRRPASSAPASQTDAKMLAPVQEVAGHRPPDLQWTPQSAAAARAEGEREHLSTVPEVGGLGRAPRRQLVTAEPPGLQRRRRRAAKVPQERGEVDVADLLLRQAEGPPEPRRQQAGPDRLLRVLSHAQVRRHRQRGKHVGQPQISWRVHSPISPRSRARRTTERQLRRPPSLCALRAEWPGSGRARGPTRRRTRRAVPRCRRRSAHTSLA